MVMKKGYKGEHLDYSIPSFKLEQKFRKFAVPRMPSWIQGHHLTLSRIIWIVLIAFFSYLASSNIQWLWMVSLMIFFQYVSDVLDGALGRHRKMGLIGWGYYMDHFLDYLYLCAVLIGYSFLLNAYYRHMLLLILALGGAFMVNAFLRFNATGEAKIVYLGIGPTEISFLFIIINALLVIFGKTYMGVALPYILGISFVGLCIVIYNTQKEIWKIDKRQNLDREK